MAVGLALAERMLAARFNVDGHDVVDHYTWVIASDGDIQEGIASEASLARRPPRSRQADRLLRRQQDPAREPDRARLLRGRRRALRGLRLARDQPRRGHLARRPRGGRQPRAGRRRPPVADHLPHAHRLRQPEQAGLDRGPRLGARRGRGPPHQGVLRLGSGQALLRAGRGARALAQRRRRARRGPRPTGTTASTPTAPRSRSSRPSSSGSSLYGGPPAGWDSRAAAASTRRRQARWPPAPPRARRSSGWPPNVPELVGGSADLASSNDTDIDGGGDVVPGDFAGRNLHFGVREHAMGAIVNGLGAARLPRLRRHLPDLLRLHARRGPALGADEAAHRSGSGPTTRSGSAEDGPTHQPIEQLPALRAMPNLSVIRPADAQRDRARLAPRDQLDRPPDGADPLAPEPADARSRERPRRRDRARRLRAARRRRRTPDDRRR